ncbi:hypothetical protein A1OO_08725 [Enterovibrio norvegicus FF-33]|uniref:hypothetical protein n=1 Tax=Enterovibrio norvegicus TaxID=188144 RepID=UPI00030B1E3A|nr:hypothetical protein [Enterovibrio norvegicus]OEE65883.1 hypothetical protein A1OO_08725 [Enterovibrio norvegicus FF-33]
MRKTNKGKNRKKDKPRKVSKKGRSKVKSASRSEKDWDSLEQFLESRKSDEWFINSKKALDWFLDHMGQDVWHERKLNVVAYFKKQQEQLIPDSSNFGINIEDEDARVAFHSDWIAWYLYLVESLYDRPSVDELPQSSRIYPFFAAIGRHIDLAKSIKGIDSKLDELLKGKANQPDSILFEILVAIMYRRNGWTVEFIPEVSRSKTPDLFVTRGSEHFYVECKRQAKVTEYSELERKEWRKRWAKLVPVLTTYGTPTHVDVVFKTEVSNTDENLVSHVLVELIRRNGIEDSISLENEQIIITANHIDMNAVNKHFDRFQVRWNSPQMIALFAGGYDSSGSYTQIHSPKAINAWGPDDQEHILNLFCEGVFTAYCAKWECIAEESIDKKAKDVRKLLSKAINQAPLDAPTIVHIAYETLHGPIVEYSRADKIRNSIQSFDCKDKDIRAIYCHAIQPAALVDSFEIAETTMRFSKNGAILEDILKHDLLLDEPGVKMRDDTHWNEDFTAKQTLS